MVVGSVVLADRYGAPALKERALDLAASNLKQLRAHPEWKDFASQHHDLVAELMGVMADKLEHAQQHASRHCCPALGLGMGLGLGLAPAQPAMDPMDPFGHIVVRPNNRGIRFS